MGMLAGSVLIVLTGLFVLWRGQERIAEADFAT